VAIIDVYLYTIVLAKGYQNKDKPDGFNKTLASM
jgi:hypothetical protein